MLDCHQECPRCGGAINLENTATEDLVVREVDYLYCEFCNFGIQTLFKIEGDRRIEVFRSEIDGNKQPFQLGKFVQQMRTAAVVSQSQFTRKVSRLREALVA